jgi:L-threonylcarbamoyladenylate synthase
MMDFAADIEQSLLTLHKGGVILFPTDTIWGLGCDATDPQAVERLFTLKRRPPEKALVVLLADERDLLQYVAAPDPAVFDYIEQAGKPTSIVFNNVLGLADNVLAADGSAAIRIVKEDFCRHLLKRFRKPITATSANFSGETTPSHFATIDASLLNAVDYAVQYRRNDRSEGVPSRMVRWTKDGPVLIRP